MEGREWERRVERNEGTYGGSHPIAPSITGALSKRSGERGK